MKNCKIIACKYMMQTQNQRRTHLNAQDHWTLRLVGDIAARWAVLGLRLFVFNMATGLVHYNMLILKKSRGYLFIFDHHYMVFIIRSEFHEHAALCLLSQNAFIQIQTQGTVSQLAAVYPSCIAPMDLLLPIENEYDPSTWYPSTDSACLHHYSARCALIRISGYF